MPEQDNARRPLRLSGARRASMALIGAFVLAMLIGFAALAVDLGTGYLARVADQRTADSAAYAGALAYNSSSSVATMNSAVANLATLNGLPAGAATASLVASPSGDGNNAVKVTVATTATLYLATIFQSSATMAVSATSYVEVKPGASACIIALLPKATGVTLSGGTNVTASKCTVASNNTVTVPCGTTITTKTVDYNSGAAPSQPCAGIKPPAGTASVSIVKVATTDPLAGTAMVTGAFAHLAAVATLTGPPGPAVPAGTTLVFGWGTPTPAQFTAVGCTGSFAGSTWTVTCPAGGTYHFGTISLSGGITLSFAVGGSSANTYDFNGAINVSGSGATFGPGTYNVSGGIITGGGTTTTFGNGNYTIGAGTVSCSGSFYSICNLGSALTFGAGAFSVQGGIYDGGGATISFGAGSSANSFTIGAGSAGYAINTTGTTTTFGDQTTGTFQTVGKISTGGGTALTLSAAPAHDMNGTFSLAGSAALGAGIYTVAGNVAIGSGGGGGTVTGSSVSIITSGSFAVAAGYTNVTLTAPTSGTQQNLVVASNGAAGASFSEGAIGNSLSGAFYFPIGPITMSGGASVGNGAGQCLELIGSAVTLTGGAVLASACSGVGAGGGSGGTVVLVQ